PCSRPCSARRSGLINIGLPAKAEKHWYGESPYPVGLSGKTCHSFCPPSARKSANSNAEGPKSPMPKRAGREVKWRRIPLLRGDFTWLRYAFDFCLASRRL